jgi:hypothetical protein
MHQGMRMEKTGSPVRPPPRPFGACLSAAGLKLIERHSRGMPAIAELHVSSFLTSEFLGSLRAGELFLLHLFRMSRRR